MAIYDNTRLLGADGKFCLMAPGDRYNLRSCMATRLTVRQETIACIVKQPPRL
ncbi:MAG: hypothetical protein R3E79_50535 [Caldilineaceae bacterium]